MTPPNFREKAKLIIKQYRQLNECLLMNEEFLELRIENQLSKVYRDGMMRAAEIAESNDPRKGEGNPISHAIKKEAEESK